MRDDGLRAADGGDSCTSTIRCEQRLVLIVGKTRHHRNRSAAGGEQTLRRTQQYLRSTYGAIGGSCRRQVDLDANRLISSRVRSDTQPESRTCRICSLQVTHTQLGFDRSVKQETHPLTRGWTESKAAGGELIEGKPFGV